MTSYSKRSRTASWTCGFDERPRHGLPRPRPSRLAALGYPTALDLPARRERPQKGKGETTTLDCNEANKRPAQPEDDKMKRKFKPKSWWNSRAILALQGLRLRSPTPAQWQAHHVVRQGPSVVQARFAGSGLAVQGMLRGTARSPAQGH
jgi:hypothetical protein